MAKNAGAFGPPTKKFLVKNKDVLSANLPRKRYKRIALNLSIDMYTIHCLEDNNADRFKHLIKYFSKRKGVWDDEIKKPEDMALKMFLIGLLATEVYPQVCKDADITEESFRISFDVLEEGSVSCTIGIHKSVSKSMSKTLRKLIDIHMNRMLNIVKNECNFLQLDGVLGIESNKIINSDDTEIDEETSKALERLSWDNTVKGEA